MDVFFFFFTDALGAVVGLEAAVACGREPGDAGAVVAALGVGAVPPLPADISHILALVVICGKKMKIESKLG